MPWNPPLLEDGGHLGNCDRSIIQGADNEVVRLHIGQLMPAIGVDSLGLRMPAVRKLADRAGYEPGRSRTMKRVCLRAILISPEKARLSHTNTAETYN
jgi:hypothetical protein